MGFASANYFQFLAVLLVSSCRLAVNRNVPYETFLMIEFITFAFHFVLSFIDRSAVNLAPYGPLFGFIGVVIGLASFIAAVIFGIHHW